jgi:hypothetical protein
MRLEYQQSMRTDAEDPSRISSLLDTCANTQVPTDSHDLAWTHGSASFDGTPIAEYVIAL